MDSSLNNSEDQNLWVFECYSNLCLSVSQRKGHTFQCLHAHCISWKPWNFGRSVLFQDLYSSKYYNHRQEQQQWYSTEPRQIWICFLTLNNYSKNVICCLVGAENEIRGSRENSWGTLFFQPLNISVVNTSNSQSVSQRIKSRLVFTQLLPIYSCYLIHSSTIIV